AAFALQPQQHQQRRPQRREAHPHHRQRGELQQRRQQDHQTARQDRSAKIHPRSVIRTWSRKFAAKLFAAAAVDACVKTLLLSLVPTLAFATVSEGRLTTRREKLAPLGSMD